MAMRGVESVRGAMHDGVAGSLTMQTHVPFVGLNTDTLPSTLLAIMYSTDDDDVARGAGSWLVLLVVVVALVFMVSLCLFSFFLFTMCSFSFTSEEVDMTDVILVVVAGVRTQPIKMHNSSIEHV